MRDCSGWTCLHHALSMPYQSPASTAWIVTALALPGVAALREAALSDLASTAADTRAEAAPLALFRGKADGAQVKWPKFPALAQLCWWRATPLPLTITSWQLRSFLLLYYSLPLCDC
jgi:hypothetical protein